MEFLTGGIFSITWQQLVMYGIGVLLIYSNFAHKF